MNITFPPDDAPEVLTAELCQLFGGCGKCPGITTVRDLEGRAEIPSGVDPDCAVLCIHACHEERQ